MYDIKLGQFVGFQLSGGFSGGTVVEKRTIDNTPVVFIKNAWDTVPYSIVEAKVFICVSDLT